MFRTAQATKSEGNDVPNLYARVGCTRGRKHRLALLEPLVPEFLHTDCYPYVQRSDAGNLLGLILADACGVRVSGIKQLASPAIETSMMLQTLLDDYSYG